MVKYILITPARNEEANLPRLIDSMVAQSHLPERWIIVDDGSSDRTAEIADRAAAANKWIEVVHRPQRMDRSFAGKVHAFNAGHKSITVDYDVIGNVDSDTSFAPDYMEFLMKQFAEDPKLGVAGTPFAQDGGYDSARDSFEGESYVSGGCQIFRRKCFEDIDGYVPNRIGGVDWTAVIKSRMKGWKVRAFQEKRYHHHRIMGTAGKSEFRASIDYGERFYCLGWSPLWHFLRVIYRIPKKPVFVGSAGLFYGYCSAWIRGVDRLVSDDIIRFHRGDEIRRLRSILGNVIRLQKVDTFRAR